MKKNHTGSALTSVIMIFFLVTLIGAPLLSMVVFNYRFREYDSAIKEAEYKNEVVMDKIATIIKNEVISAMSESKNNTTSDITDVTYSLLNYYNSAYDAAVDFVDEKSLTEELTDGEKNTLIKTEMEKKLKEVISGNKIKIADKSEEEVNNELVGLLDLDNSEDLSKGKLDNQKMQEICNQIFKNMYKETLVDSLFNEIYVRENYTSLVTDVAYAFGSEDIKEKLDSNHGAFLRVISKYGYDEYTREFSTVTELHESGDGVVIPPEHKTIIVSDDVIKVGIEVKYKPNTKNRTMPVVTLSATYVIKTPDFSTVSAIEQQSIALSNPTIDYGLIVGETLTLNGETKIDGNILARADGIKKVKEKVLEDGIESEKEVIYDKAIVLESGATLSLEGATGRIATPGDIILNAESNKETKLITGESPLYYRNLYLGDPNNQVNEGIITVNFNGDVLAKDDLEINLNSPGIVNVTQASGKNYFGYNDINWTEDGVDSSSAIVINSDYIYNEDNEDTVNISLGNLYLAGRAFIEGVRSTRLDKDGNPIIYKTGESISVKGNQIAYQYVNNGEYMVSEYFMRGKKSGIEGETNIRLKLVDSFRDIIDYENFDTEHKWRCFLEYASNEKPLIKIPNITLEEIKHIEGAGVNKGSSIEFNGKEVTDLIESNRAEDLSFKESKKIKFEEFTNCFGYYPKSYLEEESEKKTQISQWISFGDGTDINGEGLIKGGKEKFFTYISEEGAPGATLAWGHGENPGTNIYIKVPDEYEENGETKKPMANGIIIYDGDLTITADTDSLIPFNGLIIVTGNLTIEKDVTIISDKELVAQIIIDNYLFDQSEYDNNGEAYAAGSGLNVLYDESGNPIGAGGLLNSFVYDDSGSIYVAINVADRSNVVDINELVGVTDWKKTDFGRL